MQKDIQCALGLVMNYAKHTGSVVDEAALDQMIKDPHSKAVTANGSNNYLESVNRRAIETMDKESFTYKALRIMDDIGVPAHQMYTWFADPESILGKKVVDNIQRLYQHHLKNYGRDAEEVWRSQYAPQVKKIEKALEGQIDPMFNDYAAKYFKQHASGGQIYGLKAPSNPIVKLVNNAVSNLVAWNPMITTMNAFEFMPKAMAHILEEGGDPALLARAISRYAEETGGKFWTKIKRLEDAGVYGVKDHSYSSRFGRVGKFLAEKDLIGITENPLRGLSYILGEEMQKAGLNSSATKALEKVAFINRFGNEPMVFLDSGAKEVLTLMRYSISATKMYMNMLNGARQGNPKAIAALTAFSALTALQTGASSAVPMPIDFLGDKVVGDDYKDLKQTIDKYSISQGLLNTDLNQVTRPVGGLAISIGGTLVNQNLKAAASNAGKSIEAAREGDLLLAGNRFLEAYLSAGQLARIPGVNLASKKFVGAISDVLEGDDAEEAFRKKFRFEAVEE